MTEIKPCPVPSCRGECHLCYSEWNKPLTKSHYVACSECSYEGPSAETTEEAARLHKSIAREEAWIPVTRGLPAPSEHDVWELIPTNGSLGAWFIARRNLGSWTAYGPGYGIHFDDIAGNSRRGHVTHYRPHTPPTPPEES